MTDLQRINLERRIAELEAKNAIAMNALLEAENAEVY